MIQHHLALPLWLHWLAYMPSSMALVVMLLAWPAELLWSRIHPTPSYLGEIEMEMIDRRYLIDTAKCPVSKSAHDWVHNLNDGTLECSECTMPAMMIHRSAFETSAASIGIASVVEIRKALIDFRGEAMVQLPNSATEVILLSHAIWWLSQFLTLEELRAE